MNRMTLIMVVLAVGASAGAWSMRPQPLEAVQFEDTGEPLFPAFTDPNVAASLDVVAWSDEDAQTVHFSVMQKDGRWVIPSHNDYPADGTEQMAKAAASFIDVKKELFYSDDATQHAAFGVLDPDGAAGEGDEKGQRITIKDASGTVVVDVIVGKAVEGKQNAYYVRKPEEKRVYGSTIELDVSTDFADWIEKDLLKVERDDFVRIHYDPYHIDETQGTVLDRNPVIAEVADPTLSDRKEWKLIDELALPEGKTLDSVKLRGILTALASLKIVGVRPRPPVRSLIEAQLTLNPKGFFVNQQGQLFGNEGMVQAMTADGVVYSVFFGEVTHETGIALTAGKPAAEEADANADADADPDADPDAEADQDAADPGADDTTKKASRFMFVNVRYDPEFDTTLGGGQSDEGGSDEGGSGESGGGPDAPDTQDVDDKDKMPAAERAKMLNDRFEQWFYVISDSSFTQIHKDRAELFKD